MDCSPPDFSAHGILQASILECIAIPFSRESSQPRNQTPVSCIAGGFFTIWAPREPLSYPSDCLFLVLLLLDLALNLWTSLFPIINLNIIIWLLTLPLFFSNLSYFWRNNMHSIVVSQIVTDIILFEMTRCASTWYRNMRYNYPSLSKSVDSYVEIMMIHAEISESVGYHFT